MAWDEFAGEAFAGQFVVDVGGDGDDDAVLLGHVEALARGAANVQVVGFQRLGRAVEFDLQAAAFVEFTYGVRGVQSGKRGGGLAHAAAEARAERSVVGTHLVVHQFVLGGHAPQILHIQFVEDVGL